MCKHLCLPTNYENFDISNCPPLGQRNGTRFCFIGGSVYKTSTNVIFRYYNSMLCPTLHIIGASLSKPHIIKWYRYLASIARTTIKVYLSAIRHLQIANHMPYPKISSMAGPNRGEARACKRITWPTDPPTNHCGPNETKFILMKNEMGEDNMLWAAMNLCFFGF